MIQRILCSFLLSVSYILAFPQTDSTTAQNPKGKFVALPAISYSPETSLTLGGIGYYFRDLSNGTKARVSNVSLLAVYTLANQIIVEPNCILFFPEENFILRARAFYNKYPDPNYGLGNSPSELLIEYQDGEDGIETDSVNYLRFNTQRIHFTPIALKKILPNLYVGLQYQLEHIFRYERLPDSLSQPIAESIQTLENERIAGFRSGLGFNLTFDSRDNVVNPSKGYFVEFSNFLFHRFWGSQYEYAHFNLDARTYVNTWKNHTLAFRLRSQHRYAQDDANIPIRGLARLGGRDLMRGYFFGTYQDRNALSLQAEYRLPFSQEANVPLKQFWKRMGIVVFASGGKAYRSLGEFDMKNIRTTVGGGIRFALNQSQRLNVRIDYGVGLDKQAAFGGRQSGLYFYLAEAF